MHYNLFLQLKILKYYFCLFFKAFLVWEEHGDEIATHIQCIYSVPHTIKFMLYTYNRGAFPLGGNVSP